MQKVEGSSPFSRFDKGPQVGPFLCLGLASRRSCPETVSRTAVVKFGACGIRVLGPADYGWRICRHFGSGKRLSDRPKSSYLASIDRVGNTWGTRWRRRNTPPVIEQAVPR